MEKGRRDHRQTGMWGSVYENTNQSLIPQNYKEVVSFYPNFSFCEMVSADLLKCKKKRKI